MLILLMQGITDKLSYNRVSKLFIYRLPDFYAVFMQIVDDSLPNVQRNGIHSNLHVSD